MTLEKTQNQKHTNTLKECIMFRDEQIVALKEQIATRDRLIEELRTRMKTG